MNGIVTYRTNYTDLLNGIDRLLGAPSARSTSTRTPAVDIREDEDRYVLEAELSGLTEKDFDVQVHDNLLTISAKQAEAAEAESTKYVLRERRGYDFSRSFVLPKDVDRNRIDAEFRNGLLTLTLHKAESMQPRSIEVKSN